MDRATAYHDEVPYETDFLDSSLWAFEGFGLFALDLLGVSALVAGLAAAPTSPASLAVNIGPGRIYSVQNLIPAVWGQIGGTGGLPIDTNGDHNIVKQGIVRDTQALAITAPGTPGQSINYLVQIGFLEQDTSTTPRPFYNPADPTSPITNAISVSRINVCNVQLKAGIAATTGSQVTPAPDAGFVGMWVVTVAYGQTTIGVGDIGAYAGAPLVLTQPQILALINARFGPTNPPGIPDVTGLAAALAAITPGLAQGQIVGCGTSNTVGHTATQISVAVGTARDSTNAQDIVLASPITKDLTAVWAAGSGNGGRDSATAIPINSYYHVFLIWKSGPTVDVLFSQSATAPTLPGTYTKFRRIGGILTDGSGNIAQFVQTGRRFCLDACIIELAASTAQGTSAILRTLKGVPIGVKVRPIEIYQANGTVDANVYLEAYTDPDEGVPTLGGSAQFAQIRRGSFYQYPGTFGNYGYYLGSEVACSASGQLYTISNDAASVVALKTKGWIDDQGGFN